MKTFLRKIIQFVYKKVVKPVIFKFDPEKVHDRAVYLGMFFDKFPGGKKFLSLIFPYENKVLEQNILGINFKNPAGLAAGFDKDGQLTQVLGPLGFGFGEIGSITGELCAGNPKPRLWRLPKSKGLIVWYGLKNDGAEKISKRLKKLKFDIPIGVSLAKTNSPETVGQEKGIGDYIKAFKHCLDIGAYYTINISCPNAYGGEPFCGSLNLEALLAEFDRIETKKPIFVKLPPDLSEKEIDDIIETCKKHRVHGFVASNLTKDPTNLKVDKEEFARISEGKGGVSGKPVENISNKIIGYIYRKNLACRQTGDKEFVIIGVGGIFSAEDAYKKIRLGASLVQLITGMIFEGPQLVGQINEGLAGLLKRDGFKNISEAIGADIKSTLSS